MIGLFKQKNSTNILMLLVYGLLLKFNLFLHATGPLRQPEDHFLYNWLIDYTSALHIPRLIYSLVAFLLLYSQALLLNRAMNEFKLLPRYNYLPAMTYMLITSLFPQWNQFSAPLIINSFLIWIFFRLVSLPNSQKPGTLIFNIGVVTGLVTLVYKPAIVLALLVIFALFIMRPFRVQEWLINLLGITTPYYFLIVVLYLSNNLHWEKVLPVVSLRLPGMPSSIYITISIAFLVLPFFIGGLFVQNNLNKMFIQVRKSWSLLLLFLIISMLVLVINGNSDNYVNWLLCAVPLATFHAATYFYATNKIFPQLLHWLTFGYAVYLNYFLV
ncbi:MAG: hypothetical protein QM731_14850 [Chitinophagaceae bacterium]